MYALTRRASNGNFDFGQRGAFQHKFSLRGLRKIGPIPEPGESLLRMRSKATKLTSDVGNLVNIHQSENQRIEDSEHLSHSGNPNVALIFSKGPIAMPMKTILNGPMSANQVKQPLDRTLISAQCRQAIDYFDAVFLRSVPFSLE